MKEVFIPHSPNAPAMLLEADPSEYLPDSIMYKHNGKIYIYKRERRRDRNGVYSN